MVSTRGFNVSGFVNDTIPTSLSLCSATFFEADLTHLEWEKCRDHKPELVYNYTTNYTRDIIVDWSPDHAQFLEKWSNHTLKWHRHNGTLNGQGNETIKMQHFALVPPLLQHPPYPQVQGGIWKLWAVSGNLTVWTGNFTLNPTDRSGPFYVNLHTNVTYTATACVKYPFSLMSGNITWNSVAGYINCTNNCTFVQCVNKTWWKTIEDSNLTVMIVKARTELWMPVNLTRPWSDSIAVTHLYDALQVILHRSRRFVGLIIATTLAVASVTAAVAGLALQQEIQTANFVRDWHKDSHMLWQQQKDLDSQLVTDVINLQHTVSWIGDQLTVLATRSVLKCDWNSTQMCVTPIRFNISKGWDKVKKSLQGHQNLTEEFMQLEKSIVETFDKELPKLTGEDILRGLKQGLDGLNPLGHVIVLLSASFGNLFLIIFLCLFLYVVFRRWRK